MIVKVNRGRGAGEEPEGRAMDSEHKIDAPASKELRAQIRIFRDKDAMTLPLGVEFDVINRKVSVARACAQAMVTLGERRELIIMDGARLACDPEKHADAKIITAWLRAGERDPDDFQVITFLAVFVRNEWAALPRRTLKQHREIYRRITKLSRGLAEAMDETGSLYVRGGGYGLEDMGVRSLLTDSESVDLVNACTRAETVVDRDGKEVANTFTVEPCLPTMQELLERVTAAAQRLEKQGPLHAQPSKRGAERGYFVRRMGELFQRRYGQRPHEVIAALTTIALGEATDRELVAKLLP